eukprot:8366231-Alexandrium_andersonii.AAC.1
MGAPHEQVEGSLEAAGADRANAWESGGWRKVVEARPQEVLAHDGICARGTSAVGSVGAETACGRPAPRASAPVPGRGPVSSSSSSSSSSSLTEALRVQRPNFTPRVVSRPPRKPQSRPGRR